MMKTMGVVGLPSYKIAKGMTGTIKVGVNCTLLGAGGDHVGARIDAILHLKSMRVATKRASGATLDTNTRAQCVLAASLGIVPSTWGMSNSSDTLVPSDFAGWDAYVRASMAEAISIWGAGNIKHVEFRNEPQGTAATWGADVLWLLPIVRELLPNAKLTGPVALNMGGTVQRQGAMSSYLTSGGSQIDGPNFHHYSLPLQSPEYFYAHEGFWVTEAFRQARGSVPVTVLSEWGMQQSSPTSDSYTPGATKSDREILTGKYMARMLFIYRAHTACEVINCYEECDQSGDPTLTSTITRGILQNSGAFKGCTQYWLDAVSAIRSYLDCSSYSRGVQAPSTFANNSDLYSVITYSPWFVRGTKSGGDEELIYWHPTIASWADQVVVWNTTSVPQTMSTLITGGSTTTQSVPAGLSTVPVTLTDTPKRMFGTGLRFPEFQN